jgi:dihydrofolate synthase/folylpolyglutamate synthase
VDLEIHVAADGTRRLSSGTYAAALERLMARTGAGIRPGLEITKELLDLLGNPQAGLRCLHVAGTNGKGSTCRFSHRLLSQAGLDTGLFTSPHMVCVRERFVIGEEAISEPEFVALLDVVLPISERIGATYFETLTAVGALWYRDRGAQAVVLETGLGGRLDSTTAFPAEVCAVTQVGLDHTQILGDTVEKIWREKIAILRPGKPLVTCQTRTDLLDELGRLARERGGRAVILDPDDKFRLEGVPAGRMQEENLQIAVRSVELFLGRILESSEIEAALRGMRWPARFERVPGDPETILDVGHNPDAAVELAGLCEPIRPVLLFGAMSDKNWREVLGYLSTSCSAVHLAPLDTARAEDPFRIAQVFPEAKPHSSYDEAWEEARSEALARGVPLLVAGSFHTVGQAARRLWAKGDYRFWPDGIVPDPQLPGMG